MALKRQPSAQNHYENCKRKAAKWILAEIVEEASAEKHFIAYPTKSRLTGQCLARRGSYLLLANAQRVDCGPSLISKNILFVRVLTDHPLQHLKMMVQCTDANSQAFVKFFES